MCGASRQGTVTVSYIACTLGQQVGRGYYFFIKGGKVVLYYPTHLLNSHESSRSGRVLLMHGAETQTRALSLRADTLKCCYTRDSQRDLNPQLIPLQDEYNPLCHAGLNRLLLLLLLLLGDSRGVTDAFNQIIGPDLNRLLLLF